MHEVANDTCHAVVEILHDSLTWWCVGLGRPATSLASDILVVFASPRHDGSFSIFSQPLSI